MTKSERRLAWFDSLTRPLTEPEQEEYWRALHALYMREWRAARLETGMNAEALAKDADENGKLLESIQREYRQKPRHPDAEVLTSDKWMAEARKGSAMLLDAIQKAAA